MYLPVSDKSRVNFKVVLSGEGRVEAARLILDAVGGQVTMRPRKGEIEVRGESFRERDGTPHSQALASQFRQLSVQVPSAVFTVMIFTNSVQKHTLQAGNVLAPATALG